jgi:hypothetical protein
MCQLVIACVIYWRAKEICWVVQMGIPEGDWIQFAMLERISAIDCRPNNGPGPGSWQLPRSEQPRTWLDSRSIQAE